MRLSERVSPKWTNQVKLLARCYTGVCTLYFIGEELAQLDMLEGQYRAALDKHKHKRRNTRQVDDDLQVCTTCMNMQ